MQADQQTRLHTELCINSKRMEKLRQHSHKISTASLRERWTFSKARDREANTNVIPEADVTVSDNTLVARLKQISERSRGVNDLQDGLDHFPDLVKVLRETSLPAIELQIELEMSKLVDITEETKCMKEIKDILDELNSISHVFKQQLKIVRAMKVDLSSENAEAATSAKGKDQSPVDIGLNLGDFGEVKNKPKVLQYSQLYRTLKDRDRDIEDLKIEATRVYKEVSLIIFDSKASTNKLRSVTC